ncbi:AraC family transcriptional regulator [Mucilaginibacter roseus]|uniref:AraC family transcriptional regulator n=1 Tax=Mucilaginibacter roseus TaxID=1528868 RepID=A0ABS8U0J2_9SPHI|nr:AraC family transcriptional regulator [Mucilaginibacter roseus]MCD8739767.1 AraC family transcriptional regulator [Mucilaginibacter roseus]
MRLFEEKIMAGERLFVVKEERFPFNDFPLHTHPEYEIIFVMKSSGTRYVGDHIADFFPGDLCLFGPHLPHTFYNKHMPADREVHQIVIQFDENCLGAGFFNKPQFNALNQLFERAKHGLNFYGETRDLAERKMKAMVNADEPEAVAGLIGLLGLLAKAKDYTVLSAQKQIAASIQKDTARMNRIYHYLLDNFRNDIAIDDVAAMANLTVAAFCRYFKQHTRKTLSEFVNDLRIGYACRLLQQKELSILQVCFESGFNNISYFNRRFKKQIGLSPLAYQKQNKRHTIS